jgi:hypothetical protein
MSGRENESAGLPTEKTADELARMPSEPWLPVETKLVGASLLLGFLLLGLLVWISYRFFPAP